MQQSAPPLKHKLLKLLIPAVFVLVAAFCVLMISLSHRFTSQLMLSNAEQLARSFAGQSVLALLTASAENADNVLHQMQAFPDVAGAGLWTSEQQLLVWQGEPQLAEQHRRFMATAGSDEMLIWQTDSHWYLAAAVTVQSSQPEAELSLDAAPVQRLGYALLVFSKARLVQHNQQVVLYSLVVMTLAILAIILLISDWVQKITRPLRELSDQMQNHDFLQPSAVTVRGGSLETQQIGKAYQQMLSALAERDEQLRQHQQKLETLVEIRTRELTTARDAALTASRHKSEFLANMSHELRTPIQSVMGYLDLVSEQLEFTDYADLTDDLNRAQRNAERLLQMINSLLDLSKIEAGRMELHPRQVSVSSIVQQSVELVRPLLQQNELRLQLPTAEQNLLIDVEKMVQVLVNLLSNACKFTKAGVIELSVSCNSNFCRFSVRDSGIGIPPGELEKIFAPFYQVDGSQTRHTGGTGLGLAISRQFVELMGGKIGASSPPGQGAEFWVSVPLNEPKTY